jgi:hypothetical protein
MGVDRHFFGLSKMIRQDETPPALFSDPLFERSKTWILSTSNLPTCPGFGPAVDNGIGVGYGLYDGECKTLTQQAWAHYILKWNISSPLIYSFLLLIDHFVFVISGRHRYFSVPTFRKFLHVALQEMASLATTTSTATKKKT